MPRHLWSLMRRLNTAGLAKSSWGGLPLRLRLVGRLPGNLLPGRLLPRRRLPGRLRLTLLLVFLSVCRRAARDKDNEAGKERSCLYGNPAYHLRILHELPDSIKSGSCRI